MTQTDMRDFAPALKRLGMIFGKPLDADTVDAYFESLQEFPLGVVLSALTRARGVEMFMPRPAKIRQVCLTAPGVAALTEIPSHVNHDAGQYFCSVCDDTGFVRRLECDGSGRCHIGGCGQGGHINQPHGYTRACSCRGSNPVLIRQREALRQRTPPLGQERGA